MSYEPAAVIPEPLSRRQRARRERVRRTRRVLFLISGLALLLTAAVPALGYYLVIVRPMQELVLGVNDTSYTMGHLIKMARRTILQGKAMGTYQIDLTTELIMGSIGEIQDDEILRQAAPRLGISVTEGDLEERIETLLANTFEGEAEEGDTPRSDRNLDELYQQRLNILNLSSGEYRDLIRADLIRTKLEERFADEFPRADEQVHVSVILMEERGGADEIVRRLRAGEEFSQVAEEVSEHGETNNKGGDWGWYPRLIKPEFDELWFSLDVGEIGEPLERLDGVYIFKVIDYASYRELTEQHTRILKRRAVHEWLKEERERNNVWRIWDQDRYLFVIGKLQEDPLLSSQ